MSKKYLYYFSEGNDAFGGDKVTMKNTLGGKGAGLAEMTAAGMPVPQGFTITTDACTQYYADGRQINDEITADIFEHLKGLEEITGKKFGDNTNPLLVCPFRCSSVHARHDGYHPEPGPERRGC